MTQPVLSECLARWSIFFNQYEITYTPQKAVKGQALANFLVNHSLLEKWELSDEFPHDVLIIEELPPWTMFFDGSTYHNGYQALIISLKKTLDMKILQLKIYDNSKLIINQLFGSYEVKKEDILPYYQYASCLLERFDQVFLSHVPREENCMADALSHLAMTMAPGEKESTKEYSYNVLINKKPAKQWRKHIPSHVEHTNLVPSSIFASRGWATPRRQWYGIPRYIIIDNGTPFNNKLVRSLCEKFGFKQHKSLMYNAPDNGLTEDFNNTVGNLLEKVDAKNKRVWHEKIGEALWAYRTTLRITTQATPYSLVYGVKPVLPLEQQIPSLWIAIQEGLTLEKNAQLCIEELEALDEKILETQ
ncbi:uncharacterized protein LOC142170422 [Nicotiana tabacum]|uniref:Uncharacterized protein LOC142170422 n=1 Tax=Nicotiana tabacum TaxID=4097 RepID=A0AC58STX2_TOBAC